MNAKLYELKKIQTHFPCVKLGDSLSAANFVRQFYTGDIEIFESFFLLLLNRAMKTIGYAKISQGGITGTVVDVRIIAKYAVESLATGVIMVHNHPSGNLKPSDPDLDITKKVVAALAILDIKVLDHLILSADSHFSFADEGHI